MKKADFYALQEGDPCPHSGEPTCCDGTLRVHEESTDEAPIFVCNTRGHSSEVSDCD